MITSNSFRYPSNSFLRDTRIPRTNLILEIRSYRIFSIRQSCVELQIYSICSFLFRVEVVIVLSRIRIFEREKKYQPLLPLCLSYAFMHSLVMNWLIRAVFPTPLAPSIATVYEVISFAGAEFFSSPSGSVGASEFDLDLLLLNESPLLMIPVTRNGEYIQNYIWRS